MHTFVNLSENKSKLKLSKCWKLVNEEGRAIYMPESSHFPQVCRMNALQYFCGLHNIVKFYADSPQRVGFTLGFFLLASARRY